MRGSTSSRSSGLAHQNGTRDLQPSETFELEDWYGLVAPRFRPVHLAEQVDRLCDPATAAETIHWGRNYLYRTHLETVGGRLDVVVKQFRNHGFLKRLKRKLRGSKAALSFENARAFEAAGLPTAEAVLLIESKRPDGPSFFVTRHLDGVIEARYLLRAANQGLEEERFPAIKMDRFLDDLGETLHAMHEAGFFHRDLSIGNVLIQAGDAETDGKAKRLYLIDLNRARRGRLSLSQRTRDLCRLAIFRNEHQERFLSAYWGADRASGVRALLYKLYHHGFLFRIESKKKLPFTGRRPVSPRTQLDRPLDLGGLRESIGVRDPWQGEATSP